MKSFIYIIDTFININFLLNGIYDIVCSFAILFNLNLDIANIHTNTFNKVNISYFTKRLFSYWIITYAFPRIFSCIFKSQIVDILCAITYFIEGTAYCIEFNYFKSSKNEILYPILLSYAFCIIVLLRSFLRFYSKIPWYVMFYDSNTSIVIVFISIIMWIYGTKKAEDINSKL